MTRKQTFRIPLGRGRCAIVDAEDYQRLAAFKWCASKYGSRFYARRSVPATGTTPRKKIRMHRQVLGFQEGQIDHRDGDGLNNRRCNLRLVTPTQNCANRRLASNNRSGIKGVHYEERKGRWRAIIQCLGTKHHLGYFVDAAAAARAYEAGAKEYFGEFARPARQKVLPHKP